MDDVKPKRKKCKDCYLFDKDSYSGWCPLLHKVTFATCSCTAPDELNKKPGDQLNLF